MIDTIVLDLDGTLISSVLEKINHSRLRPHIFEELFIYVRPHAVSFIRFILKHYKNIYLWSDSQVSYIKYIAKLLFGPHTNRINKLFSRYDCNKCVKKYGIKKDLRFIQDVVGTPVKNMIIIEDVPSNVSKSQNHLFVKSLELDTVKITNFINDTDLKDIQITLMKKGAVCKKGGGGDRPPSPPNKQRVAKSPVKSPVKSARPVKNKPNVKR